MSENKVKQILTRTYAFLTFDMWATSDLEAYPEAEVVSPRFRDALVPWTVDQQAQVLPVVF